MFKELAVAIPASLNEEMLRHLIREDGQEDLCFALYARSDGHVRESILINEIVLPDEGDRQVHGNVSFNEQFFKRVCLKAIQRKMGVCFIHSHPFPGWQSMSNDDITAETKMAPTVFTLTDLPLVGMTVGNDGTWSARMWNYDGKEYFKMQWAAVVKSVGSSLTADFNNYLIKAPAYREHFKRTRTVYGQDNHQRVARLRIGIVGLGSVGSILAETLARMGFYRLVLIDYDVIKKHNLDRQLGATDQDLGQYKTFIADRQIRKSATGENLEIKVINKSIASIEAYEAALDCDVIFSCVDRPWPRYILNHIAYAHLIPVIDGGIKVKFESGNFVAAEWQLQTIVPGKPCLQCLGVYEPSEVDTERMGKLDDPSYLEGLPEDHHFKSNENIFPFSANLASLEIFHLISLTTQIGGASFGVQRFRFVHGHISNYSDKQCHELCEFIKSIGKGDTEFKPV